MTMRLFAECLGCTRRSCTTCELLNEKEVRMDQPADVVNKPSHYKWFPGVEVINVIRSTLSEEEFIGYCKGNSLKYRLRAGKKGDGSEDLAKARVYEGWGG